MGAALGLRAAAERGSNAAWNAGTTGAGGTPPTPATANSSEAAVPGWARQLRAEQAARHHRQTALHTLKEGGSGGAGATPDIEEKE